MLQRLARLFHHPRTPLVSAGVAGFALAGLIVLIVQQFYGLPFETRMKIGPDAKIGLIPESSNCYRWRLPEKYNGGLNHTRAVVLEDGRPLSRVMHVAEVEKHKGSHYMVRGSVVRFATVDGSDVRSNGRRYEIIVPLPVREHWFLVGGILLALALPLAWPWLRPKLEPARAWVHRAPVWLVAMLAMAAVSEDLIANADRTHGAFLVKGLPESDSQGWFEFASTLHDGRPALDGFSNQRPLYAVLLAALMEPLGASLLAGKLLNLFFVGLTAASVFALGRALGHAWAGLATAVFLCFSYDHIRQWHAVQTENAGLAFAAVATVVLVWALRHRTVWGSVLAGVLAGLGNLAAGHVLLALPLVAALLAVLMLLARTKADRLRQMLMLVAFTAGAAAMLVPWMAFQKHRNGVFTISMNSAELLAGAADPATGKMTGAIHSEADALGFTTARWKERYEYYMQRFKRDASADPVRYVKHILRESWVSLEFIEMDAALLRTLLMLALAAAGILGVRKWGAPQPMLLATVPLFIVADKDLELPGWSLLALTAGLLLSGSDRRRWLILAVLGLTIAGCMGVNGLAGNVATRRFWLVMDWALVLPALAGLGAWLDLLCRGIARIPILGWGMRDHSTTSADITQDASTSDTDTNKDNDLAFAAPVAIGVTVFCLVCGVVVLLRLSSGPRVVFDPGKIATLPALSPAPAEGQQSLLVHFDDRAMHLTRGEDVAHWLPQYEPADFARWLAFPRIIKPDGTLGGRVVLEKPAKSADEVPRWQPARCMVRMTPKMDPLGGNPVNIYQVEKIEVVEGL